MSETLLDQMTLRVTGPLPTGQAGTDMLDDIRLVLEEHMTTISRALHDQFGERYGRHVHGRGRVTALPKPLTAALGLAETLAARLIAGCLPWSSRSQHDSWARGYVEGGTDGYQRGYLAGRAAAKGAGQ